MERGTSAVERIHGEQYQIKEKTIKENTEHFALYVCVYLRFPLLVAYLMWLQM